MNRIRVRVVDSRDLDLARRFRANSIPWRRIFLNLAVETRNNLVESCLRPVVNRVGESIEFTLNQKWPRH